MGGGQGDMLGAGGGGRLRRGDDAAERAAAPAPGQGAGTAADDAGPAGRRPSPPSRVGPPLQSDEGLRFCPRCGGRLVERPIDRRFRPRCESCGFIWYKDPKVAAGTLPVLDGRIVLVRRAIRPQYGRWSYPGGYMDRGETVREAAIRETREECSLHVELGRLIDVYSYPTSIVVILVFAARVCGGRLAAGPECLEVRAFAPDEIPWDDLAFSSTRDVLRDFLAGHGRPAPGGV